MISVEDRNADDDTHTTLIMVTSAGQARAAFLHLHRKQWISLFLLIIVSHPRTW